MKHITGKSNCLPDFLSRPFDDPLFDIPYGVESKQPPPSTISTIAMPLSVTNHISPMVLRPRNKAHPLPPPSCDDDDTETVITTTESTVDSLPSTDCASPS